MRTQTRRTRWAAIVRMAARAIQRLDRRLNPPPPLPSVAEVVAELLAADPSSEEPEAVQWH